MESAGCAGKTACEACGVQLDQAIFSGADHIIKNEVLFRIMVRLLSRIGALPEGALASWGSQARAYSFDFLTWKHRNVFKRYWQARERDACPRCGSALAPIFKVGRLQRRSFHCDLCYRLSNISLHSTTSKRKHAMNTAVRMSTAANDDHEPRRIVPDEAQALRIGFIEARPWSYRSHRTLQGLDVVAIEYVAARLDRSLEYHSRQTADLASDLLTGDYDLAIGGLLPDRHRDIVALPVPHARVWSGTDAHTRIRRVFFPNVWWIRRSDLGLRMRVRMLLFSWRLSMRHAATRATHAP